MPILRRKLGVKASERDEDMIKQLQERGGCAERSQHGGGDDYRRSGEYHEDSGGK